MERTEGNIPPNLDEATRKFLKHDRVTLKDIYAKHYPSVENYVLQNSGSGDDAKDIFQEAITAAWLNTKEGKFEPNDASALGGYIFRIAKYKWLDKLKSKSYRSTLRLADDFDPEEEKPESSFQDERLEQLRNIYAQLGDKCQNILNRFYYAKMSLEDIGSEMGFDAATVKTQKYRCMKKLRQLKDQSNG